MEQRAGDLLSPGEVAGILKVTDGAVRGYIRRGLLRAEWRGGYRVTREEVDRFVRRATEAKIETGRIG